MTWTQYISIIVDSTKIDEDLTDFPLLINLSSASGTGDFNCADLFTELGANKYKIKLEDSSNNQKYIEIETWDNANSKAVLHTKVNLSSTTDSVFKLYYSADEADNITYVGVTGSTAARNVWDNYFTSVHTMAQDPSQSGACILDSTSNANHGTPYGSMTSGQLVDGLISKAISFDGSDDYIDIPHNSVFNFDSNFTAQLFLKPMETSTGVFIAKKSSSWDQASGWFFSQDPNSSGLVFMLGGSTFINQAVSNMYNNYQFLTIVVNGSSISFYQNNNLLSNTIKSLIQNNTDNLTIGDLGSHPTGGKITAIYDYILLSNTARSPAWIKATNYSLRDELAFIGNSYKIAGNVAINNIPIETNIHLYNISDGSLITQIQSDSNGDFTYNILLNNTPIDVVAISPDVIYNDLIYRVIPISL